MNRPFLLRPADLVDFLAYLVVYAPDYPDEDGYTNSAAFAEAFEALDRFGVSTRTEEGREAVAQCKRHLQVAYDYFEKGDETTGAQMVREVDDLFRQARRFITVSDE
jgi:hypothetical protein